MDTRSLKDPRLARLRARLWDRFEFLALLGQGGGGTVFEVRNRKLDRLEALKVLTDPLEGTGVKRFEHEARISASLDHPRIVKIYEFSRDAGLPWYSMQHVDGPSLAGMLEAGIAFDLPMVAGLVMPVLDALAYSHARGIIHRDIKPANILLNRMGRPFLTDFGIAKSRESLEHTGTGQMLGTPAYVAPEQAMAGPVDARADQYSLAITVYRVLAGKLPFNSENVLQTLVQRLHEPAEPIRNHRSDLPPEVATVLMRALEIDRERRWPDIMGLREALQRAFAEAGIPWDQPLPGLASFSLPRHPLGPSGEPEPIQDAGPPHHGGFATTIGPAFPTGRRRTWALAGLLAGGLLVVGVLAWLPLRRFASSAPATPKEAAPPPRGEPAPAAAKGGSPPSPQPGAASPPRRTDAAVSPAQVPPPRRPVTYPELLSTPQAIASPPGCTGLAVKVSLLIGEDGGVRSCRILQDLPEACRKAVQDLARSLQFRPAVDAQGAAVEATLGMSITLPEAS